MTLTPDCRIQNLNWSFFDMLDKLVSLTHSYEFEEYGALNLVGARTETDLLKLSFDLHIRTDKHECQSWEVDCVGLLEHHMFLGECDNFDLRHDHPLLWPYIYPKASVSFYGEAENPLVVFGALYQRHLELVRDWIPFGRFMNGNSLEMIRGRYGMLAEGPTPLVEAYAQVLERFQISSKVAEPKPAYYTNDELSGLREVGVLILSKTCYFVATAFDERRLGGG
jgi:hypothetical protein